VFQHCSIKLANQFDGNLQINNIKSWHSSAHYTANVTVLPYYVLLSSVLRLPITAKVALSSPIFVTLITEAIRSPEPSVLTKPHDLGLRRRHSS
jgi:hypothetical protein